jgi:DnaJ-domain-containing protein 1
MPDAFVDHAGPAPARSEVDRWRQVALLGVASATGAGDVARVGLAAALLSLDHPREAGTLLAEADPDDPWARWWTVLAVGQSAGAEGLDGALAAARAHVAPRGPDGREVARRLADLQDELAELAGDAAGQARFVVLGHRARPHRRALVGGRSSAVFLVDPSWDSLPLVRLGPSDGPGAGNAAHLTRDEVLEAVRRGDAGPGRRVPEDRPPALTPAPLLEALREDPATRDGRLLRLATEVQAERERLAAERAEIARAQREVAEERSRVRRERARAQAGPTSNGRPARPRTAPRTREEAAALLGVAVDASAATVQRRWREQVASCHPDRVQDLHPDLRARAEDLAASLNAARDLLTSSAGARPPARRRGG